MEKMKKLLKEFEKEEIEYVVIREPINETSDWDICINEESLIMARTILRYKDFNETKQQFSLKHKGFYKDRLSIDIQVDGVYWNDMSYLCSNQVLKNRIKKDFFYTLSDEDSFIMYLCHSILGKRKFKKEYWNRLRKLSNKKLDNKYIITTLSNVWNEKIAKMLCLYVSWNRISLIEKKIPSLVFYFIIKKPKRIVTFCLLFFRWLSRRKTIC